MAAHANLISVRAARRGATVIATTIVLLVVVLGMTAAVVIYSSGYQKQTQDSKALRVASLNARSGVENVFARLSNQDIIDLIEGADLTVTDLTNLEDVDCSGDHDAVLIWETPEDERTLFQSRVYAMDLGSRITAQGNPSDYEVVPWIRVEATGIAQGYGRTFERKLSTMYRPQGNLGSSQTGLLPMFYFGLTSVRQLRLGVSPGYFQFDAFDSSTDDWSYNPAWNENSGEDPRPFGSLDGAIASLGQIYLKGAEVYGSLATSFEYAHHLGTFESAIVDYQPWEPQYLNNEVFATSFYDTYRLSGTSTSTDVVTAFRASSSTEVHGKVSLAKGNVNLGSSSSIEGDVEGGQTQMSMSNSWQYDSASYQHTSASGKPALVELDDGTQIEVSQDLIDLLVLDAQQLAVEKGAGQFVDGTFVQQNFEVPSGIPLSNEAQVLSDAGTLGAVGYDIVIELDDSDGPIVLTAASQTSSLPASWNLAFEPPQIQYLEDWMKAQTTPVYRADKIGGSWSFTNLGIKTYWEVKENYATSSSTLRFYVSNSTSSAQCRSLTLDTFTYPNSSLTGGSQQTNKTIQNATSNPSWFTLPRKAYMGAPQNLNVEVAEMLDSSNGVYTFASFELDGGTLYIDASNGPVTIYVRDSFELLDGDVIVEGTNPVTIVQGGWAGDHAAPGEGMRTAGDGQVKITTSVAFEGNLNVQAENFVVGGGWDDNDVEIEIAQDLNLMVTGNIEIGMSNGSYGMVEVDGNAHISAGGPARADASAYYGNLTLQGEGTLEVNGNLKLELKGDLGSSGAQGQTGFLYAREGGTLEVDGDLTVDAAAVWYVGWGDLWVEGDPYIYVTDAISFNYWPLIGNQGAPMKAFVALDGNPRFIGTTVYHEELEDSHASYMNLVQGQAQVCHCDDFWGGVFNPYGRLFVLHDIALYGSFFAGVIDNVSMGRFRQDLALRSVGSETGVDFSDVIYSGGSSSGPTSGGEGELDGVGFVQACNLYDPLLYTPCPQDTSD